MSVEVSSVKSWRFGDNTLLVYFVENDQPHLVLRECMRLIYSNKDDKDNVKRWKSQWLEDVQKTHSLMWNNILVPTGFKSFRDSTASREETLSNQLLIPVSLFFALLACSVQRVRSDWMGKAAASFVQVVDMVSTLGVQLPWVKIGDNALMQVSVESPLVDGSLFFTPEASRGWLS